MAVTTRACIGRSTTTETSAASDKPCIITNLNSTEPWFPANFSETAVNGDPGGSGVRTVEVFWFVNSTTVNTDRIMRCARQSDNTDQLSLYFPSSTVIAWIFRDPGGTQRTINTTINLTGNTGVWWHSVLYKDTNTDRWQARHGRVGLTVAGAPSTADTWSQYLVQSTVLQGIALDARMVGVRASNATVGSPTNTLNTFICMGGQIVSSTGTTVASVSASTSLKGGYADLRIWSDNRGMIEAGSGDSPFDLRDQYIDGTQFPTLLHCFRFNEPNGTAVTDFDDVGVKNARFMSAVSPNPVGFASSPIPATAITEEQRIGAYKIIKTPETTRIGDYKVRRSPETTRIGDYKVRRFPETTRVGDYKVLSSPEVTRPGDYKVNAPAEVLRVGSYDVAVTPAANEITRLGQYRVLVPGEVSRIGSYSVGTTPEKTVIGSYKILRAQPTISRLGDYKIIKLQEDTRPGSYKVMNLVTAQRPGEYRIAGQSDTVTIQRHGKYAVHNPDFAATLALRKQAELRSRTR